MWWPAPSSLSLLLDPKGLLGLEAKVLKVDLCSCHASGALIMDTKICWVGWVCSFLSLATDQTPWSYSKLMLASHWAHCIEFLSQHFWTFQEPAQPLIYLCACSVRAGSVSKGDPWTSKLWFLVLKLIWLCAFRLNHVKAVPHQCISCFSSLQTLQAPFSGD